VKSITFHLFYSLLVAVSLQKFVNTFKINLFLPLVKPGFHSMKEYKMKGMNLRFWSLLAAVALLFSACGDDSPSRVITEEDIIASDELSTQAKEDLGTAITGMMNDGVPTDYETMDVSEWKAANVDFKEALAKNPNNEHAKFGMAVTNFMVAIKSESVENLYSDISNSSNPFGSNSSTGVMLKTAVAENILIGQQQNELPEMHEIQDTLAAVIIPALDEAISALKELQADPTFVEELNIDGEIRKMGYSEISTLLAGYRVIRAAFVFYVSWDLDFDQNGSYDWLEGFEDESAIPEGDLFTPAQEEALQVVIDMYSVTHPFMTIRPAWEAEYKQIDEQILLAAQDVKSALNSLPDDEMFLMNSGDVEPGEIEDANAALDSVIKYLQQPLTVTIPEINEEITIEFSAITQITNPKALGFAHGFYDVNTWDEEHPVLYFTDANGVKTGDVTDLVDILSDEMLSDAQKIAALDDLLYIPDPSFSGVFPGMTEARYWDIAMQLSEL